MKDEVISMRIIFVRHGEPDYTTDTLTENGKKEAAALAKRAKSWKVDRAFVSPLGRAKETAAPTLAEWGMEAKEYDWLREFKPRMTDPTTGEVHASWDLMPQDFASDPMNYDKDFWWDAPMYRERSEVREEWERVCKGIDGILEEYGYYRHEVSGDEAGSSSGDKSSSRDSGEADKSGRHVLRAGAYYDFRDPSGHVNPAEASDLMLHGTSEYQVRDDDDEKTIVIFCHFGVTSVMLAHLIGVSPVVMWHQTCIPPTGITVLNAEKRLHNTACFRIQSLGDTAHLYAEGVHVSGYAAFGKVFQG